MTALICLTYDDALPIHREVVAPLLAKRRLRGDVPEWPLDDAPYAPGQVPLGA